MTPIDDKAQWKFEYLLCQLELAHKRNELVDNQRFSILQVFFGFQAIILGASVLKGSDAVAISQQLGTLSLLLPLLVLGIGYSLFVVYFRQHIYMRAYKAWTANLEAALRKLVFAVGQSQNDSSNYTGTLYFDSNKLLLLPEGTLVFTLVAMGLMNLGVTVLLLQAVGTPMLTSTIVLGLGIIAHIGAIVFLWRAHGRE